jgi:hypothetical protein
MVNIMGVKVQEISEEALREASDEALVRARVVIAQGAEMLREQIVEEQVRRERNRLQAEGPDEFSTSYYEHLARRKVGGRA